VLLSRPYKHGIGAFLSRNRGHTRTP
jgi:hypothetical protein